MNPDDFDPNADVFDVLPVMKPVKVPGGYPADLFADPDKTLDLIAAFMKKSAPTIMRSNGGGVPIIAYLFCTVDPISGEPGDCLYQVVAKEPQENDDYTGWAKDAFARIVGITVACGLARGVAQAAEAWTVKPETEEEQAETRRYRSSPEGLSNHPKRQEVAILNLQTMHGDRFLMAPTTSARYAGALLATWPRFDRRADQRSHGRH